MTIPNVTMRWCRHKATCKWCEKDIKASTPVVAVMFWNKGNPDSRRWNTYQKYHPQCWVEQGMDYLNRNPYVQPMGRKPKLCKEDSRKRFLLVRRFHALEQRRHNNKFPDNVLADIRLFEQMVNIMVEVAMLGGVPKGWAEKLG